jgi:aminoglycoside phosphotransferase (APT) family kinase protein
VTAPWTAERVVTVEEAERLVDAQFSPLAPCRAELIGEGWDNTVYVVTPRGAGDGGDDAPTGDRWVFRFPRRQIAVPLIEVEARILPAIAPRLPLPIPTPRWIGRPTQEYPWPFVGYRWLTGRTADRADLSTEARAAAAGAIGSFLAALHAIDPSPLDAPGDTLARADLAARRPQLLERLDGLVARGIVDDASPWRRLVETIAPRRPRSVCLVHGDLYGRHLLVDDAGAPSGVIDWGDVHVGDPAVDLAIAWGFLPPAARGAFRDAYAAGGRRAIDEATWQLARLRALWHAAAIAIYGHDVGDAAIAREGRVGLEHVLTS